MLKAQPTITSIVIPHDDIDPTETYPLWLVPYWAELIPIHEAQRRWMPAVESLRQRQRLETALAGGSGALIDEVYDTLSSLEWSGIISGFPIQIERHYLSAFFTNEWLSSEHEDLLMDLLRGEVNDNGSAWRVELPNESGMFIPKIKLAYQKKDIYAESITEFRWLHRIASRLVTGTKTLLGTLANVCGNHWVAIVINTEMQTILHGDSLGASIDGELCSVLKWWTYEHFGVNFGVEQMEIARQKDSYSCGLFAWGALEAFFLDDTERLMEDEKMEDCRLKAFLRIMDRHKHQASTHSHMSKSLFLLFYM
ncbi:hypothetical protein K435DRAFT_686053 [Dendrothele bispora CBS 962.96]|uniref:Ubiquitin-like protease family profile domain-containing protein n=1 Tax=Dendrothele bispora (strain CBS 962.96) TaxID=1314807 RepID=A0A4S8L8X7_DENBC|nr:hypothetical protein K435DRAFT_686053 [Dendrothele bispora CBS 962.96]